MPLKPVFARAPLNDKGQAPLSLTALTPAEWLNDEITQWNAIGKALTPTGRVLSGLTPLCYMARDTQGITYVSNALDELILSQQENGLFGTENIMDCIYACQAMTTWYEACLDKNILAFLMKFAQYQYLNWEQLKANGELLSRAGENMAWILWLYNVTGKKVLLKLMDLIRSSALDWTGYFHTFSVVKPMARIMPWNDLAQGLEAEQGDLSGFYTRQDRMTRGVDLGMALKAPSLFATYSGNSKEKEASAAGWVKLMRYHGVAPGMFTADGHLAGQDPSQGICLEAAGEAAVSLANMQLAQGKGVDALEKLVYNVLAAGKKDGMVQPMQQANQLYLDHQEKTFYGDTQWNTAFEPSNVVADHAAAVMRGLASYTRNMWTLKGQDTLTVWSLAPSVMKWKIDGKTVKITTSGNYPYGDEVKLHINLKTPTEFTLAIRIPGWSEDTCVEVNREGGDAPQGGDVFSLKRTWQDGDVVHISLNAQPQLTRWYHQSGAVELGPLIMALPIENTDDWQMALGTDLEKTGDREVTVSMHSIEWPVKKNSLAAPPIQPNTEGDGIKRVLKPYSLCEKRICQFPVVEK